MAKAMRQHVGGKDSILDVFGFALKLPLLYYISCPGRKRPFAFIFSIAGCRFVNFSSSKNLLEVLWNSHRSIELRQACAIMAPASS